MTKFKKGEWTNCRYDICEIIDEDDDIVCTVATDDVELVIDILNKNEHLKKSIKRQQLSNEKCSKYIEEVVKENKQLKKDIEFSDRKQNDFFKKLNDSMNENFRLKQENEQLKEKNKQLRHDLNVLRRGVFEGF